MNLNIGIKHEEWPSDELELLGWLSCLSPTKMEKDLVGQVQPNKHRIKKLIGVLENYSMVTREEGTRYCMNEIVQKAIQEWTKTKMVPSALLKLHDTALHMIFLWYNTQESGGHTDNTKSTQRSSYPRKARYMAHFDRFLAFTREFQASIKDPVSDNMFTAVIEFSHVYLGEGRFDDAVCILDFTHKHCADGKFVYEFVCILAQAYLLYS